MKKTLLTSVLGLLFFHYSQAQYVLIPDVNFRAFLINQGLGSCFDVTQTMLDTTCSQVVNTTNLDFNLFPISSIEGIQYFDNLSTLICSGSSISFLPELPNSLSYLDCSNNSITSLPNLPNSLTYLSCGFNQLTSLPILPNSLSYLDCAVSQITSLPNLPDSLTFLDCRSNQLTSLPVLPISLSFFDCFNNQITSLPNLPGSLIHLSCGNNQLTSLPTLPNLLRVLACSVNQITSLPNLPDSLNYLECGNNPLTSLPVLPKLLTGLYCVYNQLTSLPTLPNSLTDLYCDYNQLTSLPTLPNTLTNLYCRHNELTSLPTLPDSLTSLYCVYNQLTSLPSLPNSIKELVCNGNQLTSLPVLPDTMDYLNISANPISFISQLPSNLANFYCEANPGLTCFPKLGNINFFLFDGTGVTCLPNYPSGNFYSLPPLNSLPLCDYTNSFSCPYFPSINGRVYVDTNANCLADVNETGFINAKVKFYSGGNLVKEIYNNELGNGEFSFTVDTLGVYDITLDTANLPFDLICPQPGYRTCNVPSFDSILYEQDFGLVCKPGFDVGVQSITHTSGIFRPANYSTIQIFAGDITSFYGAKCASGTAGTVTAILSGPCTYINSIGSLTPSSVIGDTITWTIPDFGAVDFFDDFGLNVQTDTFAPMGSSVCLTVNVTPTSGDNDITNNTLTNCWTVVNSYDPNDKTAYPSGDIDTTQKDLTYRIRFQNTGTAEAQHIFITDTLSAHIDEESFVLLSYSHQPKIEIRGKAVRFNFPFINLPDSNTNEPLSHGYVQYRVKLKDNLPLGTTIANTAFIYFDFNDPIITNTTSNTISLTTAIDNVSAEVVHLKLYPNPVENLLQLETGNIQFRTITIYNHQGSKILESMYSNQLDVRSLASGVYFIELKNGKGLTARKRFVKL
jgi:uncharacterized repeat protein (TIGR01451 family)